MKILCRERGQEASVTLDSLSSTESRSQRTLQNILGKIPSPYHFHTLITNQHFKKNTQEHPIEFIGDSKNQSFRNKMVKVKIKIVVSVFTSVF